MGRVIRKIGELRHGKKWNAFDDAPRDLSYGGGYGQVPRSGGPTRYYSDRSWIGSILTRLAVDFSQVDFYHARLDSENDVAVEVIRDSLHQRLTLSPNIDQEPQAFKIDYALTLFRHGHAVVVPVECDMDPLTTSGGYEIGQLRVGYVTGWHPRHLTMEVYDDREVDSNGNPVNGGIRKPMTLPKDMVMYQENPFYGIMNEPNGLIQRYLRKLEILDLLDEDLVSGDLNMLLQLPYTVRHDSKAQQAEKRRAELSNQLQNDPLGIGFIGIEEKVIQLNRPIENKVHEQVDRLAQRILAEFGLTEGILDGSATQDQVNMGIHRGRFAHHIRGSNP